MSDAEWVRVEKGRPCPVCGKLDWCSLHVDGKKVICPRVKSPTKIGDSGYLHKVQDNGLKGDETPEQRKKANIKWKNLQKMYVKKYKKMLDPLEYPYTEFAERIGMGYDGEAMTFPVYDGTKTIIGIQRRFSDGKKKFVKGSKDGLFIPTVNHWANCVFVTEGVSDCATLLNLGVRAIGRVSCNSGSQYLKRFLSKYKGVTKLVIIADNDKVGISGAKKLAAELSPQIDVQVIKPPQKYKDVREWQPTIKQLIRGITDGSKKESKG